jgi:hypothetical protein
MIVGALILLLAVYITVSGLGIINCTMKTGALHNPKPNILCSVSEFSCRLLSPLTGRSWESHGGGISHQNFQCLKKYTAYEDASALCTSSDECTGECIWHAPALRGRTGEGRCQRSNRDNFYACTIEEYRKKIVKWEADCQGDDICKQFPPCIEIAE